MSIPIAMVETRPSGSRAGQRPAVPTGVRPYAVAALACLLSAACSTAAPRPPATAAEDAVGADVLPDSTAADMADGAADVTSAGADAVADGVDVSPVVDSPIALGGVSLPQYAGGFVPWQPWPADLTLQLGQPPLKPGWQGKVYPHYSAAQVNDFDGDGKADLLLFTQGGDIRVLRGPIGPQALAEKLTPKAKVDPRVHSAALWMRPDGSRWIVLGGSRLAAWRWSSGQWVDEGDSWGVAEAGSQPRYCATPADVDADGLLDLIDCQYACDPGAAHRVWLDRGDGVLSDHGAALGLDGVGPQWAAGLVDLGGDGHADLVFFHDGCNNPDNTQAFYRFDGRGPSGLPKYQRIAPNAVFAFPKSAMPFASPMGFDVADFDGNGLQDIAVANVGFGLPQQTILKLLLTEDPEVPPMGQNWLLLQQPDGSYIDKGGVAGLKSLVDPVKGFDMVFWGVRAWDFDRDGWVDLALTAAPDHEAFTEDTRGPMRPVALRNKGDGTFADVTQSLGWPQPQMAITLAAGDLDGDGDEDVVMGQLDGQPLALRNEVVTPLHEVRVQLRGRTSNPLGVGARVTVRAGPVERSRVHLVDGPLATRAEAVTRLGVGTATAAQLEVVWPSGYRQVVGSVQTDQLVTVEEPSLVSLAARTLLAGQKTQVQVQLRAPDGGPWKAKPQVTLVPEGGVVWSQPLQCDAQGVCSGELQAVAPSTTYLHVAAEGLDLRVWPKVTVLAK